MLRSRKIRLQGVWVCGKLVQVLRSSKIRLQTVGFHLAQQNMHPDHTQTPSPMARSLFIQTYLQTTPKSRAMRSFMGLHLATQGVHPDHTQTPRPMDPHGASLGHANHTPSLWSPKGFRLAIQCIRPHDTKSRSVQLVTSAVRPDHAQIPSPHGVLWIVFSPCGHVKIAASGRLS